MATIDQPTASPTRKVASGAIAGAVAAILIYLVQTIFNVVIPAEVASAVTVVLSFLASYFVKESA